jgi:hypothetical protein
VIDTDWGPETLWQGKGRKVLVKAPQEKCKIGFYIIIFICIIYVYIFQCYKPTHLDNCIVICIPDVPLISSAR